MTQPATHTQPAGHDGRRQRSERSRQKIAQAMIDLIMAGEPYPSAEAVAKKASVGLRTVFRLYKDMDSLFLEVSQIMHARIEPEIYRLKPGLSWQDQLETITENRAKVFEAVMPMQEVSYTHRVRSPFVKAEIEKNNQTLRATLMDALPTELRRNKSLVETLDAVLSPNMWMRLRIDQKLDPRAAEKVLKTMVNANFPKS